jgi:hypothetical protein
MAPHADEVKLLRVVVREDFSLQRARIFVRGDAFSQNIAFSHPFAHFKQ